MFLRDCLNSNETKNLGFIMDDKLRFKWYVQKGRPFFKKFYRSKSFTNETKDIMLKELIKKGLEISKYKTKFMRQESNDINGRCKNI